MISKSEIKSITQLQQKKYRDSRNLFIAEGPKIVKELLAEGLKLHRFFSTEISAIKATHHSHITPQELKKISNLKTANTSLAIFEKPAPQKFQDKGLVVALDAIRDPGNLGTIIRLCDWFGVTQLVCSMDTADCYNPKVIQATMGSIARVSVQYVSLGEVLTNSNLPVFGAFMDGKNVYKGHLPKEGILVMGNEANGISEEISAFVSDRISIPQFGETTAESLNVATATAIFLSEFKRAY